MSFFCPSDSVDLEFGLHFGIVSEQNLGCIVQHVLNKMLGTLYEAILRDETAQMDLRDKALLYYRLLSTSVEEAKRVIASPKERTLQGFHEDFWNSDAKRKIYDEFNTLSVILQQPASKFCPPRELLYRGPLPTGPHVPTKAESSSYGRSANNNNASNDLLGGDLLDGGANNNTGDLDMPDLLCFVENFIDVLLFSSFFNG